MNSEISKNDGKEGAVSRWSLKRRNIFYKIFRLSFLLSVVIIAIFAALTMPRQREALINSLQSQARSVCTSISQVCGNSIVLEDYSFIVDHNMEVLRNNPDILYVGVVRDDGFSLVHTADHWEQRAEAYAEWVSEHDRDSKGEIEFSNLLNQMVYHYTFPLEYSGWKWGKLHIGLSTDQLNKAIRSTYFSIALLALFCLLVGTVGSYFFAERLTRPIIKLRELTKVIALGDLSSRVRIKTGDEIEDLAFSFNQMTEKLQETTVSKNYMNNIITHMTDCLIVTNSEWEIETVNTAVERLLGYSEDDLHKSSIAVLFPEKDIYSGARQRLADIFKEESIGNIETCFQAEDGRIIPVLFSASVMGIQDHPVQEIICVASDISLIKAVNEELRNEIEERKKIHHELLSSQSQLNQAQRLAATGRLSASIAHEINNPLQALIHYVGFVEEALPADFTEQKSIQQIKLGITRIQKTVRQLLDIHRSKVSTIETVPIHQIIDSTLELMEAQLKKFKILVEKAFHEKNLQIRAYSQELFQVLLNIILNAIDAMAQGGTLRIHTYPVDNNVRIEIKDTGIGISKENQEHLFEPFFTTKSHGLGTGLGLSIVKSIVESFNGSISIESKSGLGTLVRIEFPALSEKEDTIHAKSNIGN